jgi:hypothetical protein
MIGKENPMIELTEEQVRNLGAQKSPPRAVNPQTRETFVLLREEEYERLKEEEYDASPWTDEEMDLLAAEAGEMLDSFGKDT